MTKSSRLARESGAVLVLVVLFGFTFCGLAALVVDLALARLSQQLLQDAADVGALEGARLLAAEAEDDSAYLTAREGARDAVRRFFAPSADGAEWGAGPELALEDGVGAWNALATVTVVDPVGYRPDPELNLSNEPYGDLVVDAEGFHVNLRRTRDPHGLDRVPGVSSSGPPLPFLFGMGSLIGGVSPTGYDPRREGISVRAESVADGRRAIGVRAATGEVWSVPLEAWSSGALAGAPWRRHTTNAAAVGVPMGAGTEGTPALGAGQRRVVAVRQGEDVPVGFGVIVGPGASPLGAAGEGSTWPEASAIGPSVARVLLSQDAALRAAHLSVPFPALAPVLVR